MRNKITTDRKDWLSGLSDIPTIATDVLVKQMTDLRIEKHVIFIKFFDGQRRLITMTSTNQIENGTDRIESSVDFQTKIYNVFVTENIEVLKDFIDQGLDINATFLATGSLVHFCALCRKPKMLRMIINAGADLTLRNLNGDTLLQTAVKSPDARMVKAVLEAGVDPNERDKDGRTALHTAANYTGYHIINEMRDIVDLLVDSGIKLCARDRKGKMALDYAISKNRNEVVAALRDAMES